MKDKKSMMDRRQELKDKPQHSLSFSIILFMLLSFFILNVQEFEMFFALKKSPVNSLEEKNWKVKDRNTAVKRKIMMEEMEC